MAVNCYKHEILHKIQHHNTSVPYNIDLKNDLSLKQNKMHRMYSLISFKFNIHCHIVQPVLRGHLWEKATGDLLKEVQFI